MEVPAWVTESYGNVQIHRDETALFGVVDFIEVEGNLGLGVYVSDKEGNPIRNVAVVFEWPGAPMLGTDAGWGKQGLIEFTDTGGYAAIIMGGDSYYWPQDGQEGAYKVWLHGVGVSEMVSGLGMLGNTHYKHVDVHYRMQPTQPPPPQPPPPPPPPTTPDDGCCDEIQVLMKEILVELRRLSGNVPPPP